MPESLDQWIAGAEPGDDELEKQWVRARASNALFPGAGEKAPSVGRFELGERLGAGGMGVVYAARDPELDREVAIKLIRVSADSDREATHAEAQALAQLSHPNVVSVHDVGVTDDQVFIVMEFVRGETLHSYADGEDRRVSEIVDAYRQVAMGLAEAHRQGLIHRDIKPENAIIGDDGRVRLIDFGLAYEHEHGDAPRSGAGTPRYMAPEQVRGEALTAAADQFALCMSLREGLESVVPQLPAWLEAITARGLSEDPAERFGDLDELADALGKDPKIVVRRRLMAGGAGLAVAGAFAIGATVFAGGSELDECGGAPELIEQALSAERRGAAMARIRELGPYGRQAAERIDSQLARFAQSWSAVHQNACRSHKRGELSPPLFESKLACLDRSMRAYATVGDLAHAGTEKDVAGLVVAAQSLSAPKGCDNVTRLTAVDPPPPDVATEVADIRGETQSLRVRLNAGNYEEAKKNAEALLVRARATGYSPIIAELRLLEGRASISAWKPQAAIEPLVEATALALASGADELAVEAWARRAFAEGTTTDPAGALAGDDLIVPLSNRIGRDTFATALLYNNIGNVEIARGNKPAARDALTIAVEIARRIEGAEALEVVKARSHLALVTEDAATRDALAAESVDVLTQLVGADHPQTLEAVVGRAHASLDAGTGRELMKRACDAYRTLHPSLLASARQCFGELAWFAELDGDRAAASQAIRTAAELDESGEAPGLSALAALWDGDAAKGAQMLEKILVSDALKPDAPWWRVRQFAELEMGLGLAQAQLGQRGGARTIQRALDRLAALKDRYPVIERRMRIGRRWLEGL